MLLVQTKKVISLNYGSSTTRPVLESKGMSEKFQERGKNRQKKMLKSTKKGKIFENLGKNKQNLKIF